jgi:hypothetical protein
MTMKKRTWSLTVELNYIIQDLDPLEFVYVTVQFLLCFFFSSIIESAQPPTQRASGMTRPDRHNKGGHGSLAFVIWDIPARTMNKIVLILPQKSYPNISFASIV